MWGAVYSTTYLVSSGMLWAALRSGAMVSLSTIRTALDALRDGRMVIVVDDAGRENEGDLVQAAQFVTEESMAFLIRHTGGVVCLALDNAVADQLDLPPMVAQNTARRCTAFTVSVDVVAGITTGISARDRARTVRAAIDPMSVPADLARPGHVFPLRAQEGGVLLRAGHPEAAVDLCRLAGLRLGAVISELMHPDGTMMRRAAIEAFAAEHRLPVISTADLIAHRRRFESFVRLKAETDLETEMGRWRLHVFRDSLHRAEHVALTIGTIKPLVPALVRVHSECLTGDVLGSLHCDCGGQLRSAMRRIAAEGTGVLLYLRQEGRGIGLANKIRAYALQQREGLDTVEANERLGLPDDLRDYGIGAQILKEVNIGKMRLMTNNPRKVIGLEGYGLEIVQHVPIEVEPAAEGQARYLRTKREKLRHTFGDLQ